MLPNLLGRVVPVLRDLLGLKGPEKTAVAHIEHALGWLSTAHDEGDGGVSACFSLRYGWFPPYPETTGYIIPTFIDCAEFFSDDAFSRRALRMADWILSIQLESGAFPAGFIGEDPGGVFSGPHGDRPAVFNTGQVIFGLIAAHGHSQRASYLEAAVRAGRWIVDSQDADGAWRKNLSPGPRAQLRTYQARVAWALAELYAATGHTDFKESAERALDWSLDQQQANGFFRHASFDPDADPYTHTIAYCIEGLLEGGDILGRTDYVDAAVSALEALMRRFEIKGYLSGTFDEEWSETSDYECLTGNVQIARSMLRVFQMRDDARILNTALKLNRRVKKTQLTHSLFGPAAGGIKGSDPIWGDREGGYARFSYPNWAAKFFIDSILLEHRLMESVEQLSH